jgi:hypothetical protein
MIKRRILGTKAGRIAAVALIASAIFAAMPATTASASASCYGYSCKGHDPEIYGCNWDTATTAYAHDSTGQTIANLWNWYSFNCHTNWAAAALTAYGLSKHDQFAVSIHVTAPNGEQELMCYPGPSNTGQNPESCKGYAPYGGPYLAWCDMVEGTNVTHGWLTVLDSAGNWVDSVGADQ